MERLTLQRNSDGSVSHPADLDWNTVLDKLTDYEDMEQQGLLVRLPCVPGDEVWVVERAESGEAVDVAGHMFLSRAGDAVILSAYIDDLEDIHGTLAHHVQETAANYDTDLAVFPVDDCYTTREKAEAALKGERKDV